MTRINMRYGICRQSFVACLILILASIGSSFASTFTATLKNGTGSTVTTAYLHFELWNCGTNFPTVSGQPQTIVQFTFDLKANAMTGVITGTVLGNDVILCGNVASTEWIITPMFGQNQPFGASHKYVICDAGIPPGQSFCSNSGFGTAAFASLNPTDGVPPPSPGFNPVYSNPVASQTVTEPIGSQFAFAGTLNLCSATVLCGGSGGGGSVTAATQYAMPYYANPGTDTVISGVSAPTAPNNVPELFTSTPFGGVAALGAFNLPGVGIRASACPSNLDTVLATDRVGYVSWTDASPCTVTLPQANSSGFGSNFAFLGCNIGSGTVTLQPTTSTISYANGSAYTSGASSVALTTGQCISVKSDNANYFGLLASGGAGGGVTGSGTTGSIPVWTSSSALGNSTIAASTGQITFATIGSPLTGGIGFLLDSGPTGGCSGNSNVPQPTIGCSGFDDFFSPSNATSIGTTVAGRFRNQGAGSAESLQMGVYAANLSNFAATESRAMYAESLAGTGVITTNRGLFAFAGSSGGHTTPTNEAIFAQSYASGAGSVNTTDYTIEVGAPIVTSSGVLTAHAGLHVATQATGVPIQMGTQIFSALPGCNATYEGSVAPVTDSTTATWGATITGSSTNHVLAYCDGTNWTVAAK